MKTLYVLFAGILVAACWVRVAPAQTEPAGAQAPYVDTACGAWQTDTWVPNGDCPKADYRHERISGTIVSVKGHLVTVQQTNGQVVINDQPALINQDTGRVAVGRSIVAHGYWDSGTFFATLIATQALP